MADQEQVDRLKQGVAAWNAWRGRDEWNTHIDLDWADLSEADLSEANLVRADLSGADLWKANLSGADLRHADLRRANLGGANLSRANLDGAYLGGGNLHGANLSRAYLWEADLGGVNLGRANLTEANLSRANLTEANLIRADLSGADLTGARIFGVSAWRLKLDGAKQQNLVITEFGEPEITADDIEVAQFIYLLIHNEKLRKVIATITSKVVLILGRFTPERKVVLDALRDEVRKRNYLPVVFDFENSASRTTDETVTLLARMARFVIADLSDAKSILQELRGVVPDLPSVPVQPLILASQDEPGMFDFFHRYPWVLPTYPYDTTEHLLANLDACVVAPGEAKARELQRPQPPAPDVA